MSDTGTDYMVPDPHRRPAGDFDMITEPFYFMQTHRNTWVCMTCFANVDEHYRKQHAFYHSYNREVQLKNSMQLRPQPGDAMEKKKILFRVDIAYCNGEYWIQKVEIM